MSDIDALLITMVLLICAIGAVLAFTLWRVCLWVKQLAGCLEQLAAVVHQDLVQRDQAAGRRRAGLDDIDVQHVEGDA